MIEFLYRQKAESVEHIDSADLHLDDEYNIMHCLHIRNHGRHHSLIDS